MAAHVNPQFPAPPAPRATVLLVDDDPLVLVALRRTLSQMELRVLETTDPTQALDIIATEGVDVLLSDVGMPILGGIELLAQVRQHHPRVIRLLLTGGTNLASALEAINRGEVFRYLTKPWEPEDLRRALEEAVLRIEELRARAVNGAVAERRSRLLAELEEAYPGVTRVAPGDHVIDQAAVAQALADLGPACRALWSGEEPT